MSTEAEADIQAYALKTFFPEDDERRRIGTWLKPNNGSARTIFFRAQMLELAHWIAAFANDQPSDCQAPRKLAPWRH